MAHVLLSDVTPRIVYTVTATPTDEFPIPFPFFDLTDIAVYVNGTQITYSAAPSSSSQFSVSGTVVDGGYDDGTVTLGATVTNSTVIVQRAVPYDRSTDFPYPASTLDLQSLNTQLDRLMAQIQQVNLTYKRALRLADSDSTSEVILPDASDRANKALLFDANGVPVAGSPLDPGTLIVSAFTETLLDENSASLWRAGLGFGGAGIKGSDIASAGAITLPSTTEDYFHITGSTTINTFSARQAGAVIRLRMVSTPTLTYSANLLLKDGISRAAVANEMIDLVSEGGGVWRENAALSSTIDNTVAGGRLTLASGVAIMGSTNYTAQTTVYYTPYTGNRIALYDGTSWSLRAFTERSLSLAGLAANTNFDIFLYDSSGTLTLEAVAWTNDTTRATAITRQDGVWVKSGSTTKRLVGTIRTTATIGQCEWTPDARPSNLLVSNAQNRETVNSFVAEPTNSWNYTTAAWRSANNSTSNRVTWVQCLDQIRVRARYDVSMDSSGTPFGAAGIGISSTTTPSGMRRVDSSGEAGGTYGEYAGARAAGSYYAQALEYTSGATIQFFGDNGGTVMSSGLSFEMAM